MRRNAQSDLIVVNHDGGEQREVVMAIAHRDYASRARTLARRREVVERAREAVTALGWRLTTDSTSRVSSRRAAERGR